MWRLFVSFAFILVVFALITVRLFYLQIFAANSLKREAATQYTSTLALPASRGSLLAWDNSPLVINQPSFLVYAQPKLIESIDMFVSSIQRELPIDAVRLTQELSTQGRQWVAVAHKVDGVTVSKLKQLSLAGLGYERESKRFYPEASIAAHLTGFVGSDEQGLDKGYFGLEGYYDRELRGKDGSVELEKDVSGAPIVIGESTRIPAKNGRSLVLWMDRMIQQIVEGRLSQGLVKYGAKAGSVVVMDPNTGGIIAMASLPSYDQSRYEAYESDIYKNPVVADSFEPGSTFKTLVMAAALEEKLITPDTTMDEHGPTRIGQYLIRTWDDRYRGVTSMTDVLIHSSNVGMVFVGQKLGLSSMRKYIDAFGFGKPTGIDLQEEISPLLRPVNEWGDIDLATVSFGQGIAVTPIQMVRAVGVLANGGYLMEPKVVKEIREEHNTRIEIKPKKIGRVLSPSTARIITEMMIASVDRGEAQWAKPKGYRIAGKTGTAQIPVQGHYDEEKTIASFVGFAPADNPKFVMLVTLREPTTSPWGSETAAPLFFSIAKDIFMYWGIPPQ